MNGWVFFFNWKSSNVSICKSLLIYHSISLRKVHLISCPRYIRSLDALILWVCSGRDWGYYIQNAGFHFICQCLVLYLTNSPLSLRPIVFCIWSLVFHHNIYLLCEKENPLKGQMKVEFLGLTYWLCSPLSSVSWFLSSSWGWFSFYFTGMFLCMSSALTFLLLSHLSFLYPFTDFMWSFCFFSSLFWRSFERKRRSCWYWKS